MYLVDTSVWIDYFRNTNNEASEFFADLLDHQTAFGLTGVILQELLQGTESSLSFKQLSTYLSTQRFYGPKDDVSTYEHAAKVYFDCRRQGITIRNTIDCLIAQIAIENDLTLLQSDKDYRKIREVQPKLKLAP